MFTGHANIEQKSLFRVLHTIIYYIYEIINKS